MTTRSTSLVATIYLLSSPWTTYLLCDAFTGPLGPLHRVPPSPKIALSANPEGHPSSTSYLVDLGSTMRAQDLPESSRKSIIEHLIRTGLWDSEAGQESEILLLLAQDFVDRPEVFSTLLIKDFEFPPLVAHQTRAIVMALIQQKTQQPQQTKINVSNQQSKRTASQESISRLEIVEDNEDHGSYWEVPVGSFPSTAPVKQTEEDPPCNELWDTHSVTNRNITNRGRLPKADGNEPEVKSKLHTGYKASVVNEKAVKRRKQKDSYEYGLPPNYETLYPTLAAEIDTFLKFMTQPTTYSQEDPIRHATATVYLRHARQFLGWHIQTSQQLLSMADDDPEPKSIFSIFPNKDKESANTLIDFILWLRARDVSVAYEANILRGLIKLLKFRFAKESQADPGYGGNTFEDIPIIKEVRKLHRDANKRQRMAPRSSDEQKKWLTWPEYLVVIQKTKEEVLQLIANYQTLDDSQLRYRKDDTVKQFSVDEEEIALAYQRYLILAIFASIPDRQRTIRELELERTLVKEEGVWFVKHGPDDYKTGKSYGERPAMQLAPELTPAVDAFVENWRPSLRPSTEFFFVQSRTGKPLTGDSVFSRVSRCCFKYTGKKTNPHLLRDMIVTHVRESDASEKELEALALFMGHSIQMQRTSYDRRTLSTKIAPAVKLIQAANRSPVDG